jgi:hypothetical protein
LRDRDMASATQREGRTLAPPSSPSTRTKSERRRITVREGRQTTGDGSEESPHKIEPQNGGALRTLVREEEEQLWRHSRGESQPERDSTGNRTRDKQLGKSMGTETRRRLLQNTGAREKTHATACFGKRSHRWRRRFERRPNPSTSTTIGLNSGAHLRAKTGAKTERKPESLHCGGGAIASGKGFGSNPNARRLSRAGPQRT